MAQTERKTKLVNPISLGSHLVADNTNDKMLTTALAVYNETTDCSIQDSFDGICLKKEDDDLDKLTTVGNYYTIQENEPAGGYQNLPEDVEIETFSIQVFNVGETSIKQVLYVYNNEDTTSDTEENYNLTYIRTGLRRYDNTYVFGKWTILGGSGDKSEAEEWHEDVFSYDIEG